MVKKYWSESKKFYVTGALNRWRIFNSDGELASSQIFEKLYKARQKMVNLK